MDRWLGGDARQLIALATFEGGGPAPLLALGGETSAAVVDGFMQGLDATERVLQRRLRSDLGDVTGSANLEEGGAEGGLERLESELISQGDAQARLLAMLAHRRARLADNAQRSAALATRALAGGRLFAADPAQPAVFAAGLALGLAGCAEAAEALFAAVATHARRSGARATLAAALGQRGLELYRQGRLAESAQDLRAALDTSRGQPWETLVDDGRAHLIRVLIEQGELEDAERELERWGGWSILPDTPFGNRLLVERGRLRLVSGSAQAALEHMRCAELRLTEPGDRLLFEWCPPAALAYHRGGLAREALSVARLGLAAAESWGAPRQLGIAVRTLALIEGGGAGVGRLAQAAEILADSTARLEHARTLIELGAALRRVGHARQARTRLRGGMEIAADCGAVPLVRRGEHELAASGLRRRGRRSGATVPWGPDSLTPSERRVIRLAAGGLSNPEIANTLFVTRKTIEMHLGNAYRKLQIGSRDQLAAVIDRV